MSVGRDGGPAAWPGGDWSSPPKDTLDRRPRDEVLIQSLQGDAGAWRGDGRRWQVGERQT